MKTSDKSKSSRFMFAQRLADYIKHQYHQQMVVFPEKNLDYFVLAAPSLQIVAKSGDRAARYRTGLQVDKRKDYAEFAIYSEFSKTHLENFKRNTTDAGLVNALKQLCKIKCYDGPTCRWDSKTLLRASKTAVQQGLKSNGRIFHSDFKSVNNFKRDLEAAGISHPIDDMGCSPPSTGKGVGKVIAGSYLYIGGLYHARDAKRVINALMPLYVNFMPGKSQKLRSSNLRRALKERDRIEGRAQICAWKRCNVEGLKLLDAAHIVADNANGSDDSRNGVWLCRPHHKIQEGLSLTRQRALMKKTCIRGTCLEL